MSTPWFLAAQSDWSEQEVRLSATESHHARHVLRLRPSDPITVTNGAGTVARCEVVRTDRGRLVAAILEREETTAPRPEMVVFQAAAKTGKVDVVIEKLAELGVSETHVYKSMRAVAVWDDEKERRLESRWAAIARAASKQSRSPFVMRTSRTMSWTDLTRRIASEPAAVVLWEQARAPLREVLDDGAGRIALVVGPEGGLEPSEAEALAAAGAQPASLGPRILRTETAPVVATAAVAYHYGLLG